ncbi:MAG: DUF6484 domain-containing protein [Pseudomonadota bacterium]|nr:hypothetical protein [Pseudomonadales bacterium]MDY6919646.1 DUF6484 domain-containing protein [Pseudomonadota bacterium]
MSAFEDPQQAALQSPVYGVISGQFLGLNQQRQPLVVFPGQPGAAALPARTIVSLQAISFGAEVLLQFDQGDVSRPIILGIFQDPGTWPATADDQPLSLATDGKHLQIQAREQLELRCGEASITLTKAGKVFIKGNYLCSRATGTHSIRGGCVQIN